MTYSAIIVALLYKRNSSTYTAVVMDRERCKELLSAHAEYTQMTFPLEDVIMEAPRPAYPLQKMQEGAEAIQRRLEEDIARIHADRRANASSLQGIYFIPGNPSARNPR